MTQLGTPGNQRTTIGELLNRGVYPVIHTLSGAQKIEGLTLDESTGLITMQTHWVAKPNEWRKWQPLDPSTELELVK